MFEIRACLWEVIPHGGLTVLKNWILIKKVNPKDHIFISGHLSKRKNSYNRYKIHIFKIYQYTIKISLHDVAEKYLLRYDTLLIMIIQWQLESYKDMIYNGNLTEWSAILFMVCGLTLIDRNVAPLKYIFFAFY